ncbi:MAG TPA: hypothetical protein VF250_06810 [Conexibacter sp.]
MTNDEILVIAGSHDRDDELVAAAAAHRPRRATVLIEADDPSWGWSERRIASARRDRLAALLSAVEDATGATVVGLVGDPAELELGRFDAIVGGAHLRTAA